MITRKNKAFGIGAAFAVMSCVFAACGGDDAAVNAGSADGGNGDATTSGDDGSSPSDSSTGTDGNTSTDDGGDITDGGANFGDGGDNGDGGDLADGGECNTVAVGPAVTSDCSSTIPNAAGGAIVSGTYTLTKVTDLGSKNFCANTFTAVPFKGGIVLAAGVTSGGPVSAMLALEADGARRRSFSWSITPAAGNKSPLAVDQSCPTVATTNKPYSSFVSTGAAAVQVFEIIDDYGTAGGRAIYHFEKN